MRDYAEQINSIRLCAESDDPVDECCWEDCNKHHGNRDNMCRQKIMMDAADAIEELLKENGELENSGRVLMAAFARLKEKVPHWISVEERLPEEWREVLTYSPIHSDEKNPHMIQLCWYIGFGKWREFQYGEIMEIPVTHWMPLPEPPKGVE